jgi:hypothetical protein
MNCVYRVNPPLQLQISYKKSPVVRIMAIPMIGLTLVAGLLIVAGLFGLRQRDIQKA